MYFGRVVGCVWSTMKDPHLLGQRLLVVQPLSPELEVKGKRIICADCTGAGTGELVYWVRGKEASFPFLPQEPPVDTTIVGIVDSVHLKRAAGQPEPGVPRRAHNRKPSRRPEPC
jgi:ethanolamine utilization protein EutN